MTPAQAKRQRRELMREIAREHKGGARDKLQHLRQEIRDLKVRRRDAVVHARLRCREVRISARAKAREMRVRALEQLREATRRERLAARESCAADLTAARGIADKMQRSRAELDAERKYQRELKRIERANRAQRLEHRRASRTELRRESDDEVLQNIPPEFVGLWERVKARIRGTDRMTRTEAFLHYAHEHPDELLEVLEDKSEALIREREAEERTMRKAIRRPPPREIYADVVPF